jgi:competence protein ComEC
MKVIAFPLARITLAFVCGILFSSYFKPDSRLVFFVLFITFCIFSTIYLFAKKQHPYYFGCATFILVLAIGACVQIIHTNSSQPNCYSNHKNIFDQSHTFKVNVREKLRSTKYYDRYIAAVEQIDDSIYTGKILLNIHKGTVPKPIAIGSQILVSGTIWKNEPPKNPYQFDYSKYLENKQIYARLYTDVSAIKIGSTVEKSIWYYSSKLRTTIIQNLENTNFKKEELHVAVALILGQQQDISPEIMKDYQYAGAIHVLSVSGLHIGFIVLFVGFLLKPFPNTKLGSFIKLLIILALLSSFGIIAGLAPSVLRSVTMFSFVAIGIYLRKTTNIFHTLLVSMLLILLVTPSFLFDVGFQLSYIALFFIIWLQPLLNQLWTPKNKVAYYFWEILTVSLAAQIGTLPLSIYYFHQFPGLFFVTNLGVIPFLSVIMIIGVLVMLLAAFDYLPIFIAKLLEWSIYFLNSIINSIASLEQFIFKDIAFNWQLLVSIYLMIIATILWFKKPSFNRLVCTLITVISIQVAYFTTQKTISNQEELVIFNVKKSTLIAERKSKEVSIYTNKKLSSSTTDYILTPYLMGNFSHLITKKKIQNLLYCNGKKIFIMDSVGVYPKAIRPDIVLITQSPKINFERFLQSTKPKIVIVDASNYTTIQKLWKASCLKEKIPFHSTAEKGFYRIY